MRMPRLIWVFAGRTLILLVLLRRGSFYPSKSKSSQQICQTSKFDILNYLPGQYKINFYLLGDFQTFCCTFYDIKN